MPERFWRRRFTKIRSPVRWGVLGVLTTLFSSTTALGASVLSIHIALNEGKIVPSGTWDFILAVVLLVSGGSLLFITVVLVIAWFIKPDVGDTIELNLLKRTKKGVERIETRIGSSGESLEDMVVKDEKRTKKQKRQKG
jgi:hypothetical protein